LGGEYTKETPEKEENKEERGQNADENIWLSSVPIVDSLYN
jgi:hypothetical protein